MSEWAQNIEHNAQNVSSKYIEIVCGWGSACDPTGSLHFTALECCKCGLQTLVIFWQRQPFNSVNDKRKGMRHSDNTDYIDPPLSLFCLSCTCSYCYWAYPVRESLYCRILVLVTNDANITCKRNVCQMNGMKCSITSKNALSVKKQALCTIWNYCDNPNTITALSAWYRHRQISSDCWVVWRNWSIRLMIAEKICCV